MKRPRISRYCVYTIADGKKLAFAADNRKECAFEEKKSWVTGHSLWQNARLANEVMPVLLGDAADCTRLLFWGFLADLQIEDSGTSFVLDRVRRLEYRHTPQELVLRSSGKNIAPNFIRPYAICVTPPFLIGN